MDAAASPSLLPFALLIIACLCWVILIGILLPRLLGRSLAFLANRFFRDTSHISVPSLYIYPLAGRAVAHSVRYTIPNGTVSVEELVLQCRWWRKVQDIQFRQLLTVDDPHTLDPVAAEQQAMERENKAFFIRRFGYRLRRWWHRTAVTRDPNNPVEPRPLISLICVGLRARLVNDEKNYAHVNKVLTLARATAHRSAQFDGAIPPELEVPILNDLESSHPSAQSSDAQESGSSGAAYSSVESVDGKPWQQRALEFISLRITDGAFYFCDMGASPLVRLTVNSAKLRYRYGAAACPADECRKQVRMRVSGLTLSVSSQKAVESIVPSPREAPAESHQSDVQPEEATEESSTDQMIRRIMSLGHRGFNDSNSKLKPRSHVTLNGGNRARRRTHPILRLPQPYVRRQRQTKLRVSKILPCSEVVNATTAIIDYVFDEPGAERSAERSANDGIGNASGGELRHPGSSDTYEKLPSPVCRVSILLRGCSLSYDFQAVADIERVMERLQPIFYDLRSLARKVRSGEAKRAADGIQIEVEATPKALDASKNDSKIRSPPLVSIPFIPKRTTWRGLLAMNLRSWLSSTEKSRNDEDEKILPRSQLAVDASGITFRTEVPYQIGVAQETILSMKDVTVRAEGIVQMPLGRSRAISITRIIHYPVFWNDEHVVRSDVQVSDSEFLYLPDTTRIIEDINTTFQTLSRRPESVRYFVPFRETTRIFAVQGYRIIFSCCHDNAWHHIEMGEADKYGRMMVCGKEGELVLSPNTATEYMQDSVVLSWSLSLPNAVGKLDFSISERPFHVTSQEKDTSEAGLTDTIHGGHQKSRASALAQFVKNLETFGSHSHHSSVPVTQYSARHFAIELLRAGNSCQLSGKAVTHERRAFLGTTTHAFLDSVNRGDIYFKTSSLQLDLNPHHMTHILNLLRNYAGPGLHTIKAREGSQLEQKRRNTARRVLAEGRFPTVTECYILGLPAGITLSALEDRAALDDILCLSFQIDHMVVCLHDQPHALSIFPRHTRDACSLECQKFCGSLSSNRLGHEVSCSPEGSKNLVSLRDGYRQLREDPVEPKYIQSTQRIDPPTALVSNLRVMKRGWADEEWGTYHSELKIDISSINGCVTDTSAVRVARFASSVIPDSLHEDTLAVAAILSVENIEVQLAELDLLVLSASSAFSADRSGQMNKLLRSESILRDKQMAPLSEVPKYLSGVTQVGLPSGLRFVLSNLALADIATRARILIPDMFVNIFMPWGGKLIPWVDDVTMRAQVTHASMLKYENGADGFRDLGLLRQVADARHITIDLNFDTRPLLWSTRVTKQQRIHVVRLTSQSHNGILPWCSQNNDLRSGLRNPSTPRNALKRAWWEFLDGATKASIIEKYIAEKSRLPRHIDYLSVAVLTNVVIDIAPECLEVANDVTIRLREFVDVQNERINSRSATTADYANVGFSVFDVMQLWREFERTRKTVLPAAQDAKPSTSVKALQTKGLSFALASPAIAGRGRDSEAFSAAGYDNDEVKISAPYGINLLHMTKTDVVKGPDLAKERGERISGPLRAIFVSVNHVSVPSLELRCNDLEFIDLSGIVLISRQTTKGKVTNDPISKGERSVPQVRHSRVGRIASLSIGSQDSSFYSYACLGRVFSIFVLLTRALRWEVSSLLKMHRNRIEELCDLLFASTSDQLREGQPQGIRHFFVEAIHYLHASEEDRAATEQQYALISDRFCIPSLILHNLTAQRELAPLVVNSIDSSVHDFSLKAANHAIIDGDFFQCKGGFRSGSGTSKPHLEGHVLSASLGTIWLSIRDDTAADALQMVSEVASFVRAAAFSIPTLRHDVREREQTKVETSELLSFSYKNENLVHGKGSEPMKPVPSPSLQRGRSLWTSSLLNTNRRRGMYSGRHRNVQRRGSLTRSTETMKRNHNTRYAWRWAWNSRVSSESSDQLGNVTSPFNNDTTFAIDMQGKPAKGRKHVSHALTASAVGNSTDKEGTFPASNVTENTGRNSHMISSNPWHERTASGDQRYTYMAIRTAGESGPPRKRSKSMVRVDAVVPPAFSDGLGFASPRQTLPEFGTHTDKASKPRSFANPQEESKNALQASDPVQNEAAHEDSKAETSETDLRNSVRKETQKEIRAQVTLFVSCHRIACHYYRGRNFQSSVHDSPDLEADIRFLVSEPRLTYMSSPRKGNQSVVVTVSSAELQSANDPNCVLTGSIGKIGLTVSMAQGYVPSTLPKLIMSAQLSEFATTLHATDLQSVLTFRESFKRDLKGILSAFLRTKHSISEMARATRLSHSRMLYPGRTVYSTLAFDLLCERSMIKLEGFHPKDNDMTVSYLLDGMFFSVVASEDDNAALTLGLRLYGHGLWLASPSWESKENLRFPSLDARGVQWGEATGLPTILKVTAEPLMNSTSVQGLRHVLFTVAGLLAFQNVSPDTVYIDTAPLSSTFLSRVPSTPRPEKSISAPQASGTPFTRSFAAWERTKGVRMDISIRPMSLSLVSGQVLALFDVDAVTGIFEWNKLVLTGVQLHTAVSIPRISLSFMRMPSSEFAITEIRPNEKRTSMSIALERSRIDLLKTQEDLTHTFTFRIDVFAVSGQLRPWKLLLDAASWADEQEFVADLQAINYNSLSSGRQRHNRVPPHIETTELMQHRVILTGANIQRFILAIPLLSTEEYSSSRLALRATELHFLSRQRLHGLSSPTKNVVTLKTHFIGILWENSPLLSTHHARIAFRVKRSSTGSTAHFGETSVVMYPGTWRICPRKDVVVAILEAKNRKDNKKATEKTRELLAALPEMTSYAASSTAGDSVSYAAETQNRLLFESLSLKTFRTSGFIEGLDTSHPGSEGLDRQAKIRNDPQLVSKLNVPAFSVSMVRNTKESFDVIDIDFSRREGGEFPRGCLGKVSNLFADLFGAVSADQMAEPKRDVSISQIQHSREMTRDVSVLIRFGKSLYRAQEVVNSSMEARFGFFAGKSSSLLISLYTAQLLEEEGSHSTIITGISPRLGLEITPTLSGAKVQSLRLTDARFLYGISPSRPPHTLMHINRVTALMDAKTLLLTRNRLGSQPSVKSVGSDSESVRKLSSSIVNSERKVVFLLGKPRMRRKSLDNGISPEIKEYRVEPDIRLQMKFSASNESSADEVDLFVERCFFGLDAVRDDPNCQAQNYTMYAGFHKVVVRAQWDLLGCKFQLREALLCYDASGLPSDSTGRVSAASIVNRLQFESMQYGRNTAKLDIDAVAAMWAVPTNELLLESTVVHAEIAYTLQNARSKLSGQAMKLKNEVKLLTEKDLLREPRRGGGLSYESNTLDSALNGPDFLRDFDRTPEYLSKNSGPKLSKSGGMSETASGEFAKPQQRKISVKGDELVVTMRGYQFDEARQSAEVALTRYDLQYCSGFTDKTREAFQRCLNIDFAETRLSYVDEDRGINSDLFKIPSPKLKLIIVDEEKSTNVDLQGALLIALKHGFYYIQDFKNLAELTIMGIVHTPPFETGEPSQKNEISTEERKHIWDGKEAKVRVDLKPKIDVMGDLTEDMLHMNMISSRLGKAEVIPRQLYDFIIVPLETFSSALCDPLYR